MVQTYALAYGDADGVIELMKGQKMYYKKNRLPKLQEALVNKYGSIFKAACVFDMDYDWIHVRIRGRARFPLKEGKVIASTLKVRPEELGLVIK